MIDVVSGDLLGRHVSQCAHNLVGSGELILIWYAGKPEIENFYYAGLEQEDVSGLDVSMYDSGHVRGVQPGGSLAADFADGFGIESPGFLHEFRHGLSLVASHDHEESAVRELFYRVYGAEIGVVNGGSGSSFTEESLPYFIIACEGRLQEFYGNSSSETGVRCFIDNTHPAFTDLADQAIVKKLITWLGR
jgi:hypothetical protein